MPGIRTFLGYFIIFLSAFLNWWVQILSLNFSAILSLDIGTRSLQLNYTNHKFFYSNWSYKASKIKYKEKGRRFGCFVCFVTGFENFVKTLLFFHWYSHTMPKWVTRINHNSKTITTFSERNFLNAAETT